MVNFIKSNKNLIPILLLALLSFWTVYDVFFIKVALDGKLYKQGFSVPNIIGFSTIPINLAAYFFLRKFFKYFVSITILLGLLGLIDFSSNNLTFSISFFSFQVISFLVGVLYIILNFKWVKSLFAIKRMPLSLDIEKVNAFKEHYQTKNREELEIIKTDNRYIVEAKLAATELLAEIENSSGLLN